MASQPFGVDQADHYCIQCKVSVIRIRRELLCLRSNPPVLGYAAHLRTVQRSAASLYPACMPDESQEPPQEPHPQWVGVSHKDCDKMLQHALNRDPTVKFMVEKMKETGCEVKKSFFRVENCSAQAGGGFRPPDGVILCHNHLLSQQEVNHALTHELLHAYDHCRAANVDWHNCEHHACSEIRAASLSGDCNFKQELLRGNYGIRKQHQVCVRRRAELSLSMNPSCQGLRGRLAVDRVFDACLKDTAPFDRMP